MFAVFAATFPAISSRPSTDCSMLRDGDDEHGEQDRDDRGRDEADARGDHPVAVWTCKRERHFPTATFRRERAACRIRTPESLICAMPAELGGLPAHDLDGADGRLRLPGDPHREQHDHDHDHRGDGDHHDAERDPDLPLRG